MLSRSRHAQVIASTPGRLACVLSQPPNPSTRLARGAGEESRIWLERLQGTGSQREAAISELHGLLVRAARFELRRRRASWPQLRGGDLEDLAQQSADDALLSILAKLEDFHGESRFTTWVYKFALYEAAAKLRRRAWQGREIVLTDEAWPVATDRGALPERELEMSELLDALHEEIERALSPHQREVLIALALNEVPIDVLGERLNTTRGALYKTLHDARRKLRAGLEGRGLDLLDTGGER
ncbi:MAG: RNA polymerase sigma factor [Solirubrobacteraceae bacterium]